MRKEPFPVSCSPVRGAALPPDADGDNVIVGSSISVYERDGKYQIYAKRDHKRGRRPFYTKKYLALKAELEEMGMFAPSTSSRFLRM